VHNATDEFLKLFGNLAKHFADFQKSFSEFQSVVEEMTPSGGTNESAAV